MDEDELDEHISASMGRSIEERDIARLEEELRSREAELRNLQEEAEEKGNKRHGISRGKKPVPLFRPDFRSYVKDWRITEDHDRESKLRESFIYEYKGRRASRHEEETEVSDGAYDHVVIRTYFPEWDITIDRYLIVAVIRYADLLQERDKLSGVVDNLRRDLERKRRNYEGS